MGSYILAIFAALTFQITNSTLNIEQAFLQNNPKILHSLFASDTQINISLPDPLSFSDQISDQQAFFLFKKIFSSYPAIEFYSVGPPLFFKRESCIYKARWSFKNKRNNNQYGFHIFFYLIYKNKSENPAG